MDEYYGGKTTKSVGDQKKVHSEMEIRVWEHCWIPTISARLARPIAPMVQPMMAVCDLMIGNPKR